MSCSGSSNNSCTRTYTDGYTTNKRTAHIISVVVFAAIGAGLAFCAYALRNQPKRLYKVSLVVGVLIAAISLLALIPILNRPTVVGRKIVVSDGNCEPVSCDS